MLDQSLHILRASRTNLRSVFRVRNRRTRNLRQVRSLLAAAMTHRDSCLSGLDDENVFNSSRSGIKNKIVFSKFLNPMKETLSNALAITKKLLKFSERVIAHRRVSELGLGNPGPDEFVVVCSNGTGDYKTISEAVEAAPSSISHRFVIQISPGVYSENIFIPFQKNNLMFVGSGMNLTVIEGNRNMKDGYTTFNSATLAISGAGFLARDLTVVNTAGPAKGQAVALRVSADQAAFYRCNISGYQDTLYAHSSSQFYRDCIISGTVDFIFGNAAAVFQNCLIIVLHPLQGQRDMITAHSRDDPFQPTGFSLQNCSITAPIYNHFSSNTSKYEVYLGRPWRRYSRTMVMGSYLGEEVSPKGWHDWSENAPLDSVELMEYNNRGPGSKISERVAWARYNATKEEAVEFAIGNLIDGWWLNATTYPFYFGL